VTGRIIAGLGLLIAAALAFLVFEQRVANEKILSTLYDVNAALVIETSRSRDLEHQVAALSERVGSLEKEVINLRRRVVALSGRPVAIVRVIDPVESIALAPVVPFPPSPKTQDPGPIVIETLPITWATDWKSYQPAGIIAPPAPIVLQRKLSDPAFVKKLYAGYAALQVSDIVTTTAGLNRNAREANPLLRDIARSPAALIGVKAAATVATIFTIEKLRQRHPVAATVTLIALNATLAAVTINNVAAISAHNRVKP
jgi:Domain of unknown function (DUF5658)